MSEFKCDTFSYMKDSKRNGGYGRVGDGNMRTTLFLEKDGVKISIDDEDILKLMKCLSGVNPTIKVS